MFHITFLGMTFMRIKTLAAAITLTLLAACSGGPPQYEIDVQAYVNTIRNVPRIVVGARDEESVAKVETTLNEFETQLDDMAAKVRTQKVADAQKADLKQQIDDELKRIDDAIKTYKFESPDPLSFEQHQRVGKAYDKFVAKVRDLKFD